MHWAWDDELLVAGHRAGLEAVGREPLPALTERFRETYLPSFFAPGRARGDRISGSRARSCSREFDVELDDDELAASSRPSTPPGRRRAGRLDDARAARVAPRAWAQARARLERPRPAGASAPGPRAGRRRRARRRRRLLLRDRLAKAAPGDLRARARAARRSRPSTCSSLATGSEDVAGAQALGMTTVHAVWFRADAAGRRPGAGLRGVHADGRAQHCPPSLVSRLVPAT